MKRHIISTCKKGVLLSTMLALLTWLLVAQVSWRPRSRKLFGSAVLRLAFSKNGQHLTATGWKQDQDEQTLLINAHSFALEQQLAYSKDGASFSPDYRIAAVAGGNIDDNQHHGLYSPDYYLELRDAKNGKRLWMNPDCPLGNIEFSPQGDVLAAAADGCGAGGGSDYGSWSLWRLTNVRHPTLLVKNSDKVQVLRFSADNSMVVVGLRGGLLKLWSLQSGKMVRQFNFTSAAPENSVNTVALSPNLQMIISVHQRFSVRSSVICFWNVKTGQITKTIDTRQSLTELAISPNSQTLASGNDAGAVMVWNRITGKKQRTLTLHNGSVTALAWSPDGNTLSSGYKDGTIALWRIK